MMQAYPVTCFIVPTHLTGKLASKMCKASHLVHHDGLHCTYSEDIDNWLWHYVVLFCTTQRFEPACSDVSFLSQNSHGLLLILMTAKYKARSANVLGLVCPCSVSVQLMFESNLYWVLECIRSSLFGYKMQTQWEHLFQASMHDTL